MSKKAAPAGQLSLFDLMVENLADDSEDLTTRGTFTTPPEYVVNSHSWADNDTSPDALEKLSHVLLGDTEIVSFDHGGVIEKYVYRVETTAVIGQKVWAACRLHKSLKDAFGQALGDEDEQV